MRLLDELFAVRLFGDVTRHEDSPAARLGGEAGGLLGVPAFIEAGDQHVRALAGKCQRDGTADSQFGLGFILASVPSGAIGSASDDSLCLSVLPFVFGGTLPPSGDGCARASVKAGSDSLLRDW